MFLQRTGKDGWFKGSSLQCRASRDLVPSTCFYWRLSRSFGGRPFTAIKLVVADIGPVWAAAGRVIVGFLAVALLVPFLGKNVSFKSSGVRLIVLVALLNMVVPFVLISWAMKHVEAGVGALLLGTTPLIAMVMGHFLTDDERITRSRLLAVIMAISGIVILVGREALTGLGSAAIAAQLAIVAAGACYVSAGFVMRRIDMEPVTFTAIALGAGSVILAIFALTVSGPPPLHMSSEGFAALIWLGVLPTGLAYMLRFWLVKRVGVSTFCACHEHRANLGYNNWGPVSRRSNQVEHARGTLYGFGSSRSFALCDAALRAGSAGKARPMKARIELLDLARGVALAAMTVFHFAFDLEMLGLREPGFINQPHWKYFARAIASSFLFLAGFGLYLAHANRIVWSAWRKRMAKILGAAALITIATWFATPQQYIFFGILHQIAFASAAGMLFLTLPAGVIFATAIAVFTIGQIWSTPLLDHPIWWWTGLSEIVPVSSDYVPVFPWFSAPLFGMAFAAIAVRKHWIGTLAKPEFRSAPSQVLQFMGRHSLVYYLLHQPVMIGVFDCRTLLYRQHARMSWTIAGI